MADYILDIDTKFLQNLKMADGELKKSISNAKMMSAQFTNMVRGSQGFLKNLSAVQSALSQFGKAANIDYSKGIVSIDKSAISAADGVNMLARSMQQLRTRYDELQSATSRKGMMLKSSVSLDDRAAVEAALKLAENKLSKNNVAPARAEHIKQQVELYKAALKEMSKSDEQRTKEAIEEVQKRITKANEESDAKIKQSDKETKAIRKNLNDIKKATEKSAQKQASNPQAAMELARQARSAEELKRAYKELEQARNKIYPDSPDGKRQIKELNKVMDETRQRISRITGDNRRLRESFNALGSTVDGLKSKLAAVFGAYAIKNYVNNLIKVHGQFELINKSLKILLHSSARAERVWGQITELALKSPFQIKELATATKQMAAYRIEADQLYEKTKMLADISAGLGVEMSRLILAYGQVKAANFLRGTELRQFSEAGIDMLGQLSAYFTEIEGRAVSAADVFERISKRMVLFEDVDAVLTRVTSQGGTFYKMQEEQAQTLTGQIRNLKDEIDLMLHDIGQSTHGILITVVGVIRDIIKNWRTILPIIMGVITSFITLKTVMMAYGLYLTITQRQLMGYTTTTMSATLATHAFNTALKSNPIFLFASAVASVIAGIISYTAAVSSMSDATEESEEPLNSVAKIFDEQAEMYDKLTSDIGIYTDKIKNLKEEQKELGETDERYLEINEELAIATSARQAAIASLVSINQEYATSINDVTDALSRQKTVETELRRLYAAKEASNEFDVDALASNLEAIQKGYAAVLDSRFTREWHKFEVAMGFGDTGTVKFNDRLPAREKEEGVLDYMLRAWEYRRDLWRQLKKNYPVSAESYEEEWMEAGYGVWDVTEGGRAYKTLLEMVENSKNEYLDYLGITLDDVKNDDKLKGEIYARYEQIIAELDLAPQYQDLFRQMIGTAFGFEWPEIDPNLAEWQKGYNTYRNSYITAMAEQNEELGNLAASVSREIRSRNITIEQMKEELDGEIKELEQLIADYDSDALYATPQEYNDAKEKLKVAKYNRAFFGADTKGSKKKQSLYKDTLEAIDDIHKAFKDLEKDFDAGSAKIGAWEKYGASLDTALKKIGMTRDQFIEKFGDLTSEKSVTNAIEWLATQAKDLDEKFDIQQHLGEWRWELNLELEKEEFANVVREIDDMFAGYELSIELDKLHIPKDFAQDFFNVEAMSIDELRKRVYDEMGKFDGTDDIKKFQEYLKKIDELEMKSQQERMKQYLEFARDAVGERTKIMLDGFYELQDIASTFQLTNTLAFNKGLINEDTKKQLEAAGKSIHELMVLPPDELSDWFLTDEEIANLRKFYSELQQQQKLVEEANKRNTDKELDELAWKTFKSSETLQMMMSDLDNMSEAVIVKMIEQLESYKEQWKDMPISDIEDLNETLEKLRNAQAGFETPRNLRRTLNEYLTSGVNITDEETGKTTNYKFDSIQDAQLDMVSGEVRIQSLEQELAVIEQIYRLKSEGVPIDEISNTLAKQGLQYQGDIESVTEATINNQKNIIEDEKEHVKAARQVVGLVDDINSAYKKQSEDIKDIQKLTNSLFDAWGAINSLFEDDSMSSFLADTSKYILDSVLNAILLQGELFAATVAADGLGAAINTAMGPIGWAVLATQVLTKLLKFAFEQHDKNLQKRIDEQAESVEELKNRYEELKDAIEDAYTAANLSRFTQDAIDNLNAQISATEKMIALEEDKKKTDDNAIEGWKDSIAELKENINELKEDAFSTLTDGILDNVLDTTRGFVDAWHDACEETGDGMKGLEENFTEMLRNMLRQQASMQLISPFIKDYKDWLSQYVNEEDPTLTAEEARAWAERVKGTFPELNELLKGFFEGTQGLLETEGGLSDLEKGIQGMTEDQAEVLAAYWNSCRFLLTNIDTSLTKIASSALWSESSSNSVLSELKAQTALMQQIHDKLDSVIGQGGSSFAGPYIKSFMA